MEEAQHPKEQGPLPQTRDAVDWWLTKWGRQEPLNREDVERLIEVNGGTGESLDLTRRDIRKINLWRGLREDKDVLPFELAGANLSWSDLRAANLSGADLQEARLFLADLRESDLKWTNLQECHLRSANFQGADLSYADLRDAELQDSDLEGATMVRANMRDAELRGANLRGANLPEADFRDADLREADLRGANLSGTDLRGADLRQADLRNVYLATVHISSDTNFEGAKWDADHISKIERLGEYHLAAALYRRLKEWYDAAGMPDIAGDFHYREREAARKAEWHKLRDEMAELVRPLASAWEQLKKVLSTPAGRE